MSELIGTRLSALNGTPGAAENTCLSYIPVDNRVFRQSDAGIGRHRDSPVSPSSACQRRLAPEPTVRTERNFSQTAPRWSV